MGETPIPPSLYMGCVWGLGVSPMTLPEFLEVNRLTGF